MTLLSYSDSEQEKDYCYCFLIPRNSIQEVILQDAKQINDCPEKTFNLFFFFITNSYKKPTILQISLMMILQDQDCF